MGAQNSRVMIVIWTKKTTLMMAADGNWARC